MSPEAALFALVDGRAVPQGPPPRAHRAGGAAAGVAAPRRGMRPGAERRRALDSVAWAGQRWWAIAEFSASQREVHGQLTSRQSFPGRLYRVRELVSCCHCKRAVLLAGRFTPAEMVQLSGHLADCRPDDPFDSVRVEDAVRHFRRVAIETEERPVNTVQFGGSNGRT